MYVCMCCVCYHLISATVISCKILKICRQCQRNVGPEIKAICCETPVSLRDDLNFAIACTRIVNSVLCAAQTHVEI